MNDNKIELVVVDDDDLVLTIITRLLRHDSCTVIGHTNPEAGLAHLLESSPDFLFVDWRMPRINGLVFLQMLQDQGGVTDTKIFFNSGAHPPDSDKDWLCAQNIGFVGKAQVCDKKWLRTTLGFSNTSSETAK